MKIRVEFTVNIPRSSLPALKELAAAEDPTGIRDFIRMDAALDLVDYLSANGVAVTIEREKSERRRS